jgi:hypothetical protein
MSKGITVTTIRLFLPCALLLFFFVPRSSQSPCLTWIPCADTTRVTRLQIRNGVPGLKLCSASANLHRTPLLCSSTWFELFRFKTCSRYRQSVTTVHQAWQGWLPLCYPCFNFDIACSCHPEAVDIVTCGWVTSCARAMHEPVYQRHCTTALGLRAASQPIISRSEFQASLRQCGCQRAQAKP